MDGGRALRALATFALLAPLSIVPSFATPASTPEAADDPAIAEPAPEGLADSTRFLPMASSGEPTQLYRLRLESAASFDGEPARFRIAYDREVDASAEPSAILGMAEPPSASDPAVVGSLPLMWIASAQSTLAALGGAIHAATETIQANDVAASFVAVRTPAELALQPPADWMVAAFWAVFLTALGALFAPRFAMVAGGFLYARLATSQMEAHPRRARVLESIRQSPGQNVAALQRETGITGGGLRHHLEQLERHGLVRRLRAGRATHWFPATGLPVRAPPTPSQARLLQELQHEPGRTVQELSRILGVSGQNVWKQLRRLGQSRWVTPERNGRNVRWVAVP